MSFLNQLKMQASALQNEQVAQLQNVLNLLMRVRQLNGIRKKRLQKPEDSILQLWVFFWFIWF